MNHTPRARARRAFRGPRHATGIGMIEVLIAIVILAFGLLGIAALQMTALRGSQSSLQRSQATMQTYAILDAMRANREAARIGGYNLSKMTCKAPDRGSLAMNDLANWIGTLKQTLGDSACAMVVCGAVECEISVQWDDARAAGDSQQTVKTVTRL
ncbi:type IV pilus modification protein PilV [Lysobacter tyrosinilyticus]